MAGSNGDRPELAAPAAPEVPPGMMMIPMNGGPSDIIIGHSVAAAMLGNLLDRDDMTFTVLLGEAMTGRRLARVRARDNGDPRPGPEDRAPAAPAKAG